MEYRFFDGGPPRYSELDFFQDAPHVRPEHQVGHRERTAMVASAVRDFLKTHEISSYTDLGCGDGQLLHDLRDLEVLSWGYDAGAENIAFARDRRLDVRYADILNDKLDYGDLSSCCEVLEHLYDPKPFLRKIESKYLVVSSPSVETPDWHYPEHAWGWDIPGYRLLVESCGWEVLSQYSCVAKDKCDFMGTGSRFPEFQCLVTKRSTDEKTSHARWWRAHI